MLSSEVLVPVPPMLSSEVLFPSPANALKRGALLQSRQCSQARRSFQSHQCSQGEALFPVPPMLSSEVLFPVPPMLSSEVLVPVPPMLLSEVLFPVPPMLSKAKCSFQSRRCSGVRCWLPVPPMLWSEVLAPVPPTLWSEVLFPVPPMLWSEVLFPVPPMLWSEVLFPVPPMLWSEVPVPVPPILSAVVVIFGLIKVIPSASSKACGKGCVPATSMKLPISIFANVSGGIVDTSTDKPPIVRIPRLDAISLTWPATKTVLRRTHTSKPETVTKAAFRGEERGSRFDCNQTARDERASARNPCQFPSIRSKDCLRINQIRLSKDCDLDRIGGHFFNWSGNKRGLRGRRSCEGPTE